MKKLNNKGFTLVELLAVIIILAIVVGISIPAITSIINDSKNKALGTAVDIAEDYLSDQYGYYNIDTATVQGEFADYYDEFISTSGATLTSTEDADILKDMGFDTNNVSEVKASINSKGIACVEVTQITTSSDYFVTQYWTVSSSTVTPNTNGKIPDYRSKSCTTTTSSSTTSSSTTLNGE